MTTTTAIKERPVIFSAQMILALLDGRKSMTRRVVQWKPRQEGLNLNASSLYAGEYFTDHPEFGFVLRSRRGDGVWEDKTHPLRCPYGQVGDRLWCRETWCAVADSFAVSPAIAYAADRSIRRVETLPDGWTVFNEDKPDAWKWRPSIHMFRWASRITLEITDVRVERLQDISHADRLAEGIALPEGTWREGYPEQYSRNCFVGIWDRINGKRQGCSWSANPWVWALAFKRVEAGA